VIELHGVQTPLGPAPASCQEKYGE